MDTTLANIPKVRVTPIDSHFDPSMGFYVECNFNYEYGEHVRLKKTFGHIKVDKTHSLYIIVMVRFVFA